MRTVFVALLCAAAASGCAIQRAQEARDAHDQSWPNQRSLFAVTVWRRLWALRPIINARLRPAVGNATAKMKIAA
jgi:hypothetical protein